jgi:hypothetical protein
MRLTLLALALLAGCAHVPPPAPPPDPAKFYPLSVGNRWSYDQQFLGSVRQLEVAIVDETNGFFQDNSGQKLTFDSHGLRDDKRYLLRSPLVVGRTWTNVVSVSSTEYYKVLEVGGECEAPAGKFSGCVRVESRNRQDPRTTLVNEMTFAPGVGLVRVKVIAETGQKRLPQTELTLRDYSLKVPR